MLAPAVLSAAVSLVPDSNCHLEELVAAVQLSQAKPCTVVPATKKNQFTKLFGANLRILFLALCVCALCTKYFCNLFTLWKSWVVQPKIRSLQFESESGLHKKLIGKNNSQTKNYNNSRRVEWWCGLISDCCCFRSRAEAALAKKRN